MRHLADRDVFQLLSAWPWQTEHFRPAAEGSDQLSLAQMLTSASTGFKPQHAENNSAIVLGNRRPSPAAFRMRKQAEGRSQVGSAKTLGTGPPCATRVRALRIQTVLWAPSTSETDGILKGMQELPDWEDSPPARWSGPDSDNLNADYQQSPTQPSRGAQRQRRQLQPNQYKLSRHHRTPRTALGGIGAPRTKQSTSPLHPAPIIDKRRDTEG